MTEVAETSIARNLQTVPMPAAPVSDARAQIAELTMALAARDHFIAFVGHELRNGLAPLLLLADQFGKLDEDRRAVPSMAARAALVTRNLHRVIATINWITEAADLCRGTLRLQRTAGDFAEITRDVCGEYADDAAGRGVELVVEAAAPVAGTWDRARLKQVVSHLVSNAIRHAGGCVEVRVTGSSGDVELVVRDHGPGIEPSVLAQLADPFAPERRRRPGGLGIGLWIVRTLIAMMRGTVTVNSCGDGGTRFCLVVPRG